MIDLLLGEGTMDFSRLTIPVHNKEDNFDTVIVNLQNELNELLAFLQENYSTVSLSVETNYQGVFETAGKRIQYINFIKAEYLKYFSKTVSNISDKKESVELMRTINQFDYLFQIHDSINDLYNSKKAMMEQYIEPKGDVLVLVRNLSSQTLNLFEEIRKSMASNKKIDIKAVSNEVQEHLDEAHKKLLVLLADSARRDAGTLTNFTTYSQRLKDKLLNFYRLCQFNEVHVPTVEFEAGIPND